MIEVKNLTKFYGDHAAVHDLSFIAEDGEILGLLGPNGAGKSTTMNMLTGYISSSSGQALINGIDILDEPIKAKAQIGYLPELPPLYLDMTVNSYLNFVYDLKKCHLPRRSHLQDVCSLCKITDVRKRIIKHLSKGYRQRVGLAQALIGNPPVLILDEPTVGLDPKQILEIRTLVRKLGKKHTVILSSHILSEVQEVCDRVVIIDHGQIAANDTIENLSRTVSGNNRLKVSIGGGSRLHMVRAIRDLPGVVQVEGTAGRETDRFDFEIEMEPQADVRVALNELVQENAWVIYHMDMGEMTLEDVFLKITMGDTTLSTPEKDAADEAPRVPLRSEKADDSDSPGKEAAGIPSDVEGAKDAQTFPEAETGTAGTEPEPPGEPPADSAEEVLPDDSTAGAEPKPEKEGGDA